MFGRKKAVEPETMLFYYYDGQAGLPMEPGYDKIALISTDDPKKLRMDIYHRPTGDGEAETKTSYSVSDRVLDEVMKLVKKHRIASWEKRQYPSMCGRIMYCKFIRKGELLSASSDCMPEKGRGVFSEIKAILYAYADSKAIIEKSRKGCVAQLKVSNIVRNTMDFTADESSEEENPHEPVIFTVHTGSAFCGFNVTEVNYDYVRFNSDLCRYIVNDGPADNEFTVCKGETLKLDLLDISDASDITFVELSDVKEYEEKLI